MFKQLEMHGCILSTVATDALVLKHQAISVDSTRYSFYLTSFIQHIAVINREQCLKIKSAMIFIVKP